MKCDRCGLELKEAATKCPRCNYELEYEEYTVVDSKIKKCDEPYQFSQEDKYKDSSKLWQLFVKLCQKISFFTKPIVNFYLSSEWGFLKAWLSMSALTIIFSILLSIFSLGIFGLLGSIFGFVIAFLYGFIIWGIAYFFTSLIITFTSKMAGFSFGYEKENRAERNIIIMSGTFISVLIGLPIGIFVNIPDFVDFILSFTITIALFSDYYEGEDMKKFSLYYFLVRLVLFIIFAMLRPHLSQI